MIRIRADNGFPECQSCAFVDSDVCESCEEADHYEPGEEGLARMVERHELLAA